LGEKKIYFSVFFPTVKPGPEKAGNREPTKEKCNIEYNKK
jgi:hypothetical protein